MEFVIPVCIGEGKANELNDSCYYTNKRSESDSCVGHSKDSHMITYNEWVSLRLGHRVKHSNKQIISPLIFCERRRAEYCILICRQGTSSVYCIRDNAPPSLESEARHLEYSTVRDI